MSGHNKWSQIKHRKGAQDAKKSITFSKILGAISIAAKADPSPDSNPRLRTLIEKARQAAVPNDNITRAISRAKEQKDLKEFIFECIGPDGISVVVEGITDNSNRTIQQLRTLAQELGCKPADPGSLMWGFELTDKEIDGLPVRTHQPKFPQPVSEATRTAVQNIVSGFEEHDDVMRVITTIEA